MQTYLAVTPDKLSEAMGYTDRIAHVAYRIGDGGELTRSELPPRVRGGIMVLGDQGCGGIPDCAALCDSVWKECQQRGFCAVLADFDGKSPERVELLCMLSDRLRTNGRGLYVPECYGEEVPQANVLICTAISGGTLRGCLEEARCCFGLWIFSASEWFFRCLAPAGRGDVWSKMRSATISAVTRRCFIPKIFA